MTTIEKLSLAMPRIRQIAVVAGNAINDIRGTLDSVDEKTDGSPVTRADRVANNIIVEAITELNLPYPIISEEGDLSAADECPVDYWLIDPLDGTKEFIKGLDDFTVNIALVLNNQPVLGIVHLPAADRVYFALKNKGAWRLNLDDSEATRLAAPGSSRPLTAVISRSHASPQTMHFLKQLGVKEMIARGSSLKLCAVAEGAADLYPRFNPTYYWDTAAGAAIALEAGCLLFNPNGTRVTYRLENGMKHYGFILCTLAVEKTFGISAAARKASLEKL